MELFQDFRFPDFLKISIDFQHNLRDFLVVSDPSTFIHVLIFAYVSTVDSLIHY